MPYDRKQNQEFLKRQFDLMRSQLFVSVETTIADKATQDKLKDFIRLITGGTWDNFTMRFVGDDLGTFSDV